MYFYNEPFRVHRLKRARLAAWMKLEFVASGCGDMRKVVGQNRRTRFFYFYLVHFDYVNFAVRLVGVEPLVQVLQQKLAVVFNLVRARPVFAFLAMAVRRQILA